MTTRTARRVLIGLGILAGALGFATVLAVVLAPGRQTPDTPPTPNQYGAMAACETFVKQRTSEGATFTDEKALSTSPSFIIQGVVNAGNFRRQWTCTVQIQGSDWVLVTLDGLGS